MGIRGRAVVHFTHMFLTYKRDSKIAFVVNSFFKLVCELVGSVVSSILAVADKIC